MPSGVGCAIIDRLDEPLALRRNPPGIELQRGRRQRVAELRAHVGKGRALGKEQARVGVAEIVRPEAVERRALDVPLIGLNTGEVLDRDLVGILDLIERDAEGRVAVMDLKTSSGKYPDPQVDLSSVPLAQRKLLPAPGGRLRSR